MSKSNGSGSKPGTSTRQAPNGSTAQSQDPEPSPKTKHAGGRPTKRTPDALATVIAGIREGLYVDFACAKAGIKRQTLHDWRRQFPDVEKACAEAEALWAADEWARLGGENPDPQWQRRAWRLERRFPEYFASRQRLEHTGKDGAPLRVLAWPWEMSEHEHGEGATPTAASVAGNGGPVNGSVPGHRVRAALGENGSKQSHST